MKTSKKTTKKSNASKIFVTGASGFLGLHLLESLRNRNVEYTVCPEHHKMDLCVVIF